MILVYRRQGDAVPVGAMDLCVAIAGMAMPSGLDVGAGAGARQNAIACGMGNAGQLPGVLYVRAACSSRSDCVSRSVYSQLQQRRVWAG